MRLQLFVLLLTAPLAAQRPVPALLTEYDRLAALPLWPGFTPATTPLAIYDGAQTWLVRHPAPPAGFAPAPYPAGIYRIAGQHEAVRSNTHVQLDGVPTATLLWPDRPVDLTRLAATLIHEAFHTWQATAHPGWFGNEATLFTYPVTDSAAQQLQRLETEAFRRALQPGAPVACWTSRAMALRTARARLVGNDAMAYERGNELNEGLATYVEWRASGSPEDSLIPRVGYAPAEVRLRAYGVGPVQAFLLDRLQPGWIQQLEADTTRTLDALLAVAVAPISCRADFSRREADSVAALAGRETGSVLTDRATQRRTYLARPGWQLIVVLPDTAPLWPEQFDPWNLTPLPGGEVLHRRHLRLGGNAGRIEVLDQWALTVPAGAHPLFNGIRRVIVSGLAERPAISSPGDSTVIRGAGIEATFTGMQVVEDGRRLTVQPR